MLARVNLIGSIVQRITLDLVVFSVVNTTVSDVP